MSNFLKQINEDILEYQRCYNYLANIKKPEWAFNYWVLDKLFYVDEELIEEKIVDYSDLGIDAYEVYPDAKEIYLIQNKYYSETSTISTEYVKNDFLIRAITALENGTYKRSEELQSAFTRFKNEENFSVFLQLFVTNNNHVKEADDYIKEFNRNHPKYIAQIFYLDDIEKRFFSEIRENKKQLSVTVESVNKGTILNINSSDYKLANVLDARYVMTPVASIFRLYRNAIEKQYPIFENNIRDFLGNKGINKKIYETLMDPNERKNFFYYNNGITIICDKMHPIRTQNSKFNLNAEFTIDNPQIVNGCQTVNSIYEALKNIELERLEMEFKDTLVMLKILVIDRESVGEKELYKNIVRFNNSQNSIDEKTFVANSALFNRLQREFENKGFLLLIKQSDKNKYKELYESDSKFKYVSKERVKRFGLSNEKLTDLHIPLEKLLQVINAFAIGGYVAYVKKSNVLKQGSAEYNRALEFIQNPDTTTETLLDLYLLYKSAEQKKKLSNDKRTPIPYYLIDGFAKYECKDRMPAKIGRSLSTAEDVNKIIHLYQLVTSAYVKNYFHKSGIEYNQMIKLPIDYDSFDMLRCTFVETN